MAAEREVDIVLKAAEEGGFVVSVPDLPSCWTQGETRGSRHRTRALATGRVRMQPGSRRVRVRLDRYGRQVLRWHARVGRRVVLVFRVDEGAGATHRRRARLLPVRPRPRTG